MKILYSLYAWIAGTLYFLFFLLFALAVSFLFPARIYDPWIKALLRGLFTILGIKVQVEGREYLQSDQTYLFMANHVSLFDIPLLGGFIPGIVRGVEALRQHQWPLYGWVMRRLGNVPIPRSDVHGSVVSIRKTIRIMDNGRSMIILPEGHRTTTGIIGPFKKLPFFLAKQVSKDLVPIGLSGLFTLKSKNSWLIRSTTITIKFGKPIAYSVISEMNTLELRDMVKSEIDKLANN